MGTRSGTGTSSVSITTTLSTVISFYYKSALKTTISNTMLRASSDNSGTCSIASKSTGNIAFRVALPYTGVSNPNNLFSYLGFIDLNDTSEAILMDLFFFNREITFGTTSSSEVNPGNISGKNYQYCFVGY